MDESQNNTEQIEKIEIEFTEEENQLLQWKDFFKYFPMVDNSWDMHPIIWQVWKSLNDIKKFN